MCALATRLREDIAGLQRRIGGRDTSADGPIRLTAPDAVSEYLLPGVLAELCREHPGLTIDLVVSNEVLSLSQRAADVALRITPNPTESLHARRVGTVAMGIYTVRDADAPPQANDLLTRPWIGFDAALACSGPGQWVASHVAPEQIRFRANTLLGAAQAAKGGLGCCVLPCFVGGAIAELQRVGPALQELALPLWLMVHPDMVRLPRIRRACDALANKLVQAAPLLAGEP
jgi:DNA-binding transcriptional LysR family regulator